MSKKVSAGIVLYRRDPALQFFLGHMGGPFWEGKDAGAWGIPKGLVDEGEQPLDAAIRECEEECGYRPEVSSLLELGHIDMKGGKRVHAWACEVDSTVLIPGASNFFEIEWPPKSGLMQSFPEVDCWEWIAFDECAEKLYRRALEGYEKQLGPDHPSTLGNVYGLGILLNEQNRRPEAIKLLRSYVSHSAEAEDTLAYNLACYECLEGNADEAKRLIAAHLKKHPEKKENALKDEDFAAIWDWIRKL